MNVLDLAWPYWYSIKPVSVLWIMTTSSNGSSFRVTGPLCGEFSGDRWISLTKTSDAELWCFLWSAPEETIVRLVIWDGIALIMTSFYCVELQTWWWYNASPLTFSLMPNLNWFIDETHVASGPGSLFLYKYAMIFIYFVLFLSSLQMLQLFMKHKYEFIFYISPLHWSLRWRTRMNSFQVEDNGPFVPISILFGRCCMW